MLHPGGLGWQGADELTPVYEALLNHLNTSTKLFMDETPAPVLDPGRSKVKKGYFWALARDDRAWNGPEPPGVAFTYAPGRSGKYIAKYWDGLILFLTGGHIELDGNAVEPTIRPIALQRKNTLFTGHEAGAQNWAMLASLIETCKLNGIEPHSNLTGILTAIGSGHKQKTLTNCCRGNLISA